MTTRPARESDLDRLLALYGQIRPEQAPVRRSIDIETRWTAMLADPALLTAVVESEGALAATAMLVVVPSIAKGPAPFGLIEHVVTAQAFRGRGFAGQLMRYLLEVAWRRGCYKVMLLSGAQRADAHRLYAKLGFDGDAERGYVIKPPGARLSPAA